MFSNTGPDGPHLLKSPNIWPKRPSRHQPVFPSAIYSHSNPDEARTVHRFLPNIHLSNMEDQWDPQPEEETY